MSLENIHQALNLALFQMWIMTHPLTGTAIMGQQKQWEVKNTGAQGKKDQRRSTGA